MPLYKGDNIYNIHEEILVLSYQNDLQEWKCMKVNLCGYKDSTIKYSGMMEEMPTRLFSSL
jgi:hypothetical protein